MDTQGWGFGGYISTITDAVKNVETQLERAIGIPEDVDKKDVLPTTKSEGSVVLNKRVDVQDTPPAENKNISKLMNQTKFSSSLPNVVAKPIVKEEEQNKDEDEDELTKMMKETESKVLESKTQAPTTIDNVNDTIKIQSPCDDKEKQTQYLAESLECADSSESEVSKDKPTFIPTETYAQANSISSAHLINTQEEESSMYVSLLKQHALEESTNNESDVDPTVDINTSNITKSLIEDVSNIDAINSQKNELQQNIEESSKVLENAKNDEKAEEQNFIEQNQPVVTDKEDKSTEEHDNSLVVEEQDKAVITNQQETTTNQTNSIPNGLEEVISVDNESTLQETELPATSANDVNDLQQENAKLKSELKELNINLTKANKVIQAREQQVISMSNSHASITEEVNALKEQIQEKDDQIEIALQQLADKKATENADKLKQEFTTRLGEMEKKIQLLQKEREKLRTEIKSDNKGEIIEAKNEEIKQLREEGEKLSKKQLKYETTLKKLRASIKEFETSIANKDTELTSAKETISTQNEKIATLEEENKKFNEAIVNMKQVTDTTAKKLEEKTMKIESQSAQISELQAGLETAWRDLAEQKKIQTGEGSKAEIRLLEAQSIMKEEFSTQLENERKLAEQKEKGLQQSIRELRSQLSHQDERAAWREEELRREITELNERLELADQRNEEITAQMIDSSKPLLRQISSLQQAHAAKQRIWEKLENNLNIRLEEEQNNILEAQEANRQLNETLRETSGKVKAVQLQLSQEQSKCARLNAEIVAKESFIDTATREKEELQDTINSLQKQLEAAEAKINVAEQQLKELNANLEAKTTELEQLKSQKKATIIGDNNKSQTLDKTNAQLFEATHRSKSLMDARQPSFGNNPLGSEQLHSTLQQRSGAVDSLSYQMKLIEQAKSKLEDELVRLTNENDKLKEKLNTLENAKKELNVLKHRHNTALELMGEREEEVEELRQDLKEIKQLYKMQINELVIKIEELSKKEKGQSN